MDQPVPAPVVEMLPQLLLVGLRQHFDFDAEHTRFAELWFRFAPVLSDLPAGIPGIAFGVSLDTPAPGFDYMAAISMRSLDDLPPGVHSLTIPPRRWARFHHDGDVAHLNVLCDAIFARWPGDIGIADTQPVTMIERYGSSFDPLTGTGGVDILVPLKD